MTPAVHLFHIAYSMETLAMLRPGFALLDNLSNPRPDWYESWPIRQYLHSQTLDEQAFYGFFSPKFFLKTGLEADHLRAVIAQASPDTEAFTVCPQEEVGAFFLNPVYGSQVTDPGALTTAQQVFDLAGMELDIASQVMDSSDIVYSNYVIAKPAYWRKWLALVDLIYQCAEDSNDTDLKHALRTTTQYEGSAQRKVFLIECLPSLLFRRHRMKVQPIAINQDLAAKGVLYPFRQQAFVCDALKMAYKHTGQTKYLQAFSEQAQQVLDKFQPAPPVVEKSARILMVVATRHSEEEFHRLSATGKSLAFYQFPFVELKLFANNATGLPTLYNQVIQAHQDEDLTIVFAHDDLHFLDFFWARHVFQGLEKHDLIGVVGNRVRHPFQPSWAYKNIQGEWDAVENLSGTIAHGKQFPPDVFAVFGQNGQVSLLDGLLLAAKASTFKRSGLRFDERFQFHFYDLDVCRQASQLQLTMGTVPVSVMHESEGSFNNQAWLDAYKTYVAKWGD